MLDQEFEYGNCICWKLEDFETMCCFESADRYASYECVLFGSLHRQNSLKFPNLLPPSPRPLWRGLPHYI